MPALLVVVLAMVQRAYNQPLRRSVAWEMTLARGQMFAGGEMW